MSNFGHVFSLAILGIVTLLMAPWVPHADETARNLASAISSAGQTIVGAAMALATANIAGRARDRESKDSVKDPKRVDPA